MKTPDNVVGLEYDGCCKDISLKEHKRRMKGAVRANQRKINQLVKRHLPDLYTSLALEFYNPYKYYMTDTHLILVHSATEYFLKYTRLSEHGILRETPKQKVCSPEGVYEHLKEYRKKSQEHMIVITLNTKNNLIAHHIAGIGTLDSTLIHPREIFRPAIIDAAASIIISHNHPSGDPSPSPADLKITKSLIKAGNILEIKLLDHVILGANDFCSLRESGLASF